MRFAKFWTLALLLNLAACGGGDDEQSNDGSSSPFEGVYQVESYTVNSSSCDVEGSFTDFWTDYFKLEEDSGWEVLGFYECSAADSCDSSLWADWSLDTYDEDGGTGGYSSWSYYDGSCSLSWVETVLSWVSDAHVRLEQRTYELYDVPVGSEDECEEVADDPPAERECVYYSVLEGNGV